MDTDNAAPETRVPIKVPEPADHAPPTLAEPASGPVAEMSGALTGGHPAESKPTPSVETPTANGAPQPSSTTDVTSAAPAPSVTALSPSSAAQQSDKSTEPAGATAEDSQDVNGTPSNKKAANGRRKSVGGIPEHKSKKLGKKKSMPKITHLDAKPGDYFFARLKSYPPWPSIICDEEMLPSTLINTRPVTTLKKDGTYNEAYADGGKKVTDRTFPVMFLYTNEFAWIPNTDLVPLAPEQCKDVVEKGKSKMLLAAYEVAAEGHDLPYFKGLLLDHAKALEEDEQRKQDKESEKAAKADRKKRKSEAKAEAEDVEMEDAGEESAEVKKSSKKRKKEADSDDEAVEKTPKTTKLKLTTNKTPATTEKKPKEKAAKAKGEKRKSKGAVSDDEMPDAAEEKPEEPIDPVEARKAREKEVLFLRHKLQKGFLTRDQAPQEAEMPQMSNFIKKLENYGELEVSIIRNTKINKVLRAMLKLVSIPKDEEYHFRKRSMDLLSQWTDLLDADGDARDNDNKATPNGVQEEKNEDKSKEEPVGKPATDPAAAEAEPSTDASKSTETPATTTLPIAPSVAAHSATAPTAPAPPASTTESDKPTESASPLAPRVDAIPTLAP